VQCGVGSVYCIGFGLGNIVSLFTGFDTNIPYDWALLAMVFFAVLLRNFCMFTPIKSVKMNLFKHCSMSDIANRLKDT